MKGTKKATGVKRAVVYIVILGVVCTVLGVAAGMLIEKRYTARYLFPQIARRHLLRQLAGPGFPGKKIGPQLQKRIRARAEKVFERISQELELSPEQRDGVKAVLEGTREHVNQARDEFRRQVEQAKTESDTQILGILDAEQQEKFKRLKAHIAQRRRGRRPWQCQRY